MENESWLESKTSPSPNTQIDQWLVAVQKLSKAVDALKAAKENFKAKMSSAKKKILLDKDKEDKDKEDKDKEDKDKEDKEVEDKEVEDKEVEDKEVKGKKIDKKTIDTTIKKPVSKVRSKTKEPAQKEIKKKKL